MTTPIDLWAPFALRIQCGPLDLRAVTDDDLPPLVDLALGGIHEPERMPFAIPWTDAPRPDLPRNVAAYYWSMRASFTPEAWNLDLAVRLDGRLVGVQSVRATAYVVRRSAETGSWLGREFQGQGIGTRMRKVVCAFTFDHLGAQEVTSAAFTDNPMSLAVSQKVGYVDNGTVRRERRPGELAFSRQLVLTQDRFVRPAEPVVVAGVEPLRAALGLTGGR